ncbi:MAG: FtsK/SpoIIIE domain-containing protein [Pirellulaceae bacterium]|nr:AAA family ATPase [Planctomycetales bacterium]
MTRNRISTNRQRELIARSAQLVTNREASIEETESQYQQQRERLESDYATRKKHSDDKYDAESGELESQYVGGLEAAKLRFETQVDEIDEQRTKLLEEASEDYEESIRVDEATWRHKKAQIDEQHDADVRLSEEVRQQVLGAVESNEEQWVWLEAESGKFTWGAPPDLEAMTQRSNWELGSREFLEKYVAETKKGHELMHQLGRWKSIRFLQDGWPVMVFVFALLSGIYPAGSRFGWTNWIWIPMVLGGAILLSLVSWKLVAWYALSRSLNVRSKLAAALLNARDALTKAAAHCETEAEARKKNLAQRRSVQLKNADLEWERVQQELREGYDASRQRIEQRMHAEQQRVEADWDAAVRPLRDTYPPKLEMLAKQHERNSEKLKQEFEVRLDALEQQRLQSWHQLVAEWKAGMTEVAAEFSTMNRFCGEHFPAWSSESPNNSTLPHTLPALRFGDYTFSLEQFDRGIPDHPRLTLHQHQWQLPAVLTFPESPSLLIEAEGEGRRQAIRVMQNTMLRLLTSLPAGKVRFTIIDPTGLGENFSAFMHLADFDERLVSNRIWTETAHINQRLADLTEHMENVIQKYLRNEFASIQEYNEEAGEVAEPFQILVVANFPANFSDEAARRLISISSSGARCGVYTLISVDTKMDLPKNFDLADLEPPANVLIYRDTRFQWKYPQLERCPLSPETPPADSVLTSIIKAAGQRATEANRVEVPFETVVPNVDRWWTRDSRDEVLVPLGRAGATKLQYLQLGKGTSQHVLIAGKTGSGKSTLLNALITNLALHYSPNELEFFLIDFKKGVEFKPYAEHKMPHARVIAIESEREFGMSVLERLDEELRIRGDRFRACGAQSVKSFRDSQPDEPMPRQLLIVDEFQEFFVKDDNIAQEASLLLDRLVRQGRAFGIHVILGSQTLAGAYSLARSTIGQMAVRIALQCSEADAHLILSEENTAARLLSRPGEAIYNNANGLFEGNHPFQVVWMSDHDREAYLKTLRDYTNQHAGLLGGRAEVTPVVFEGNVAADPAENPTLRQLVARERSIDDPVSPRTWLGAAIAIKNPAEITFRRQSGCHVLVVGQQEEMAIGALSNMMLAISAHAQAIGQSARNAVCLLDGGTYETSRVGLSTIVRKQLAIDCAAPEAGSIASACGELAGEVRRRLENNIADAPSRFLIIYNLPRFRDLRKSEDSFGLGSFSDTPAETAADSLAYILKEGSSVGVHVVVWCDTYNNVTRWFDRQTMREFSRRVLFQMSATDSSNLMDSAAASRLGVHRAILYSDERGEFEKFRPYAVPSATWSQFVVRHASHTDHASSPD